MKPGAGPWFLAGWVVFFFGHHTVIPCSYIGMISYHKDDKDPYQPTRIQWKVDPMVFSWLTDEQKTDADERLSPLFCMSFLCKFVVNHTSAASMQWNGFATFPTFRVFVLFILTRRQRGFRTLSLGKLEPNRKKASDSSLNQRRMFCFSCCEHFGYLCWGFMGYPLWGLACSAQWMDPGFPNTENKPFPGDEKREVLKKFSKFSRWPTLLVNFF